jgi:hypothetical protein
MLASYCRSCLKASSLCNSFPIRTSPHTRDGEVAELDTFNDACMQIRETFSLLL